MERLSVDALELAVGFGLVPLVDGGSGPARGSGPGSPGRDQIPVDERDEAEADGEL